MNKHIGSNFDDFLEEEKMSHMSEKDIEKENMSQDSDKIYEELSARRKKRLEELKEAIAEHNPEALFADGHDHAIMGYATDGRVIYSVDQIICGLMNRDGMTKEEADEFFSFNIECAYVGDYTPIYMYEE
jgi:hypothetical protein|tara:strand:- start:397 stop:786 length:390 start_codon:yes stop_codon:yes gene_type:complete